MKKFKGTLIATGVGAALAMLLSGPVLADGHNYNKKHQADSGNSIRDVDHSAVATDHASASWVKIGDVSIGVYSAKTKLDGTVKDNYSEGIHGNYGGDGGYGGWGGTGNKGDSTANARSKAIGGDGGNGGDVGADGHKGGDWGGGEHSTFGYGGKDKGGSGGEGGDGGNGGGFVASGALALATTGNGASGGNGGSANGGSAGYFAVSNSISGGSFSSAAGIMNVSQNTGANSLTQQGVTVQGNVHF